MRLQKDRSLLLESIKSSDIMKVCYILRDIEKYEDRFKLFSYMSRYCDVDIYTNSEIDANNTYSIRNKSMVSFSKKLDKYIEFKKYDIIHDTFFSLIYSVIKRKKMNNIVISHYSNDFDWFFRIRKEIPYYYYDYHKLKSLTLSLFYLYKVNNHFVQTSQMYNDIKNITKKKNVYIVPTCIDLSLYKDFEKTKKYEIFTFLYVGNIFRVKGIFNLIKAFKEIREKIECQLYFIGNIHPFERKRFFNIINEKPYSKYIFYYPYMRKKDLIKTYLRSHCFIFPSYHEGSPRVIKEALACKLPVIASNIPGNLVIDPNKQIVNYYQYNSYNDLKNVMENILFNYVIYQKKSENSFDILEKFKISNVAKVYLNVYKEIEGKK